MNVADDLMSSLAVFIRHDHHDAITETIAEFLLLAFYWLAIFNCLLRSFANDVRKILIVLKNRDAVHYLHFIAFTV